MKLTPIEDRVILKPVDAADMTSGGVILPDMNINNNGEYRWIVRI